MTARVDERCVVPASDPLALREAVDGDALERDLRRPARQQVGEDAAGAGPHGPAERAVAGVEIEVGEAGRADERAAVRAYRPEAGPELHLRQGAPPEIGKASCRARGCTYMCIPVG